MPGHRDQFRLSNFHVRTSEAGKRQSTIANKGRFLWLRPRTWLCLAASVVLCLSCHSSLRQDVPLTELRGGLDPLTKAFNSDVGRVRLMLLLDPT
jgi:hypothetical protein